MKSLWQKRIINLSFRIYTNYEKEVLYINVRIESLKGDNRNMQEAILSIIIPAYNVEKYIGRCLNSLLCQADINSEIIVSDDGSTDGTKNIVEKYMKLHQNIRMISHENVGLYRNRWIGIKAAKGKYITFCDADDYLDENSYASMINQLESENIDVLEFGYRRVSDKKNLGEYFYPEANFQGVQCLENMLEKYGTFASLCNKIYRRDLFKHIDSTSLSVFKHEEDTFTNIQIFSQNTKLKRIPNVYYNYYEREGSITRSKYEQSNLMLLKTTEAIMDYIELNFPQLKRLAAIKHCAAISYCYMMNDIYKVSVNQRELENEFERVYKENRLGISSLGRASWKRKGMLRLFHFSPKLCTRIFKAFWEDKKVDSKRG